MHDDDSPVSFFRRPSSTCGGNLRPAKVRGTGGYAARAKVSSDSEWLQLQCLTTVSFVPWVRDNIVFVAVFDFIAMSSPPNIDFINLNRLVARLEKNILEAEVSIEYRLRTSSFQRAKIGVVSPSTMLSSSSSSS